MGQALYRTYRSRGLAEIVGQEHITQTLATAIEKGLISHAYLFTGPRGTGKTSIARILAHEINKLPYSDDSTHLDIIEIDAASNRRIDEIRDLRDKVHIAPTSATYKVYIIDEVHMLTREAFNALLKTLEEPPAHVVFILATTEVHKLPETIISRTQRFTFRPIDQAKVVAHLREIASKEKFEIDDAALQLLAEHGGGSMRDSISVFDQMRSLGRAVTAQDIASQLGVAATELILSLLDGVEHHNAPEVLKTLKQLQEQGAEAAQIAKQFSGVLRERFIANEQALTHAQSISLLTKLLDVPSAGDPMTFLQIILLDIALAGRPEPVEVPHAAAPTPPPASVVPPKTKTPDAKQSPVTPKSAGKTSAAAVAEAPSHTEIPQKPAAQKVTKSEHAKAEAPNTQTAEKMVQEPITTDKNVKPTPQLSSSSDDTLDAAVWPQVVMIVKKKYNTLYSILRMARPTFKPGVVVLEVGFAFHQKRLNEHRNKEIIAETIEQLTGQSLQIQCELGKRQASDTEAILPPSENGEVSHNASSASTAVSAITDKPENSEPADYYVQQAEEASERPLDTVSNIFGGGELLES